MRLTWAEVSLFTQLSKPRDRNAQSRAATVAVDIPWLLSVRATLEPCRLYFP